MDLLPDDSSDIKKAKSVMRWDAKRKKYLPTMVTVDGKALKGQRRNESGKKVKGEARNVGRCPEKTDSSVSQNKNISTKYSMCIICIYIYVYSK